MTPRAVIAPQHGRGVTWRQGTRGAMRSRFAAVRVRPAHRDDWQSTPRPEEWLVIEGARGGAAAIKDLVSTLAAAGPRARLGPPAMPRLPVEARHLRTKGQI